MPQDGGIALLPAKEMIPSVVQQGLVIVGTNNMLPVFLILGSLFQNAVCPRVELCCSATSQSYHHNAKLCLADSVRDVA